MGRKYAPSGSETDDSSDNTVSDDSSSSKDCEPLVLSWVRKRSCCAVCSCLCCTVSMLVLIYTYASWRYWNWLPNAVNHCPIAYDASLMRPVAEAARVAFCLDHDKYNWSCAPCVRSGLSIVDSTFTPIHGSQMGQANQTYGYIVKVSGPAAYAGACLVAFRGTVTTANCASDADSVIQILPLRYACPWCGVHSGFYQAWAGVEDVVVDGLRSAGCSAQGGLIVTGHSMGAALATLAAWSLTRVHGYELRMFYSFESPRLGNPAFLSAFTHAITVKNATAFRMTYDRDIVPHVPPVFAGFEHVGCEVYYAKDGSFKVCEGSEDASCSAKWPIVQTDPNLQPGPNGGEHCNTVYAGDLCVCSESDLL